MLITNFIDTNKYTTFNIFYYFTKANLTNSIEEIYLVIDIKAIKASNINITENGLV
jgi:hypothetical protein